ncbi:Slam-dependent surface lipoprotein [Kerstersia gyiorum]|uniref:Transferrin-binding protein B C-lobe/N-lobe beta barrel domain-containing protein n=1 Tax=Kerstersia gyiorum TaxID=206506 RepID=A0A4V2F0E6_9BURK|nr:Slam-dependent surface lipoprotein [Kerstersia gyiorum]KAB0544574.1 transferrin-binding protein-like solute binding protein [Kerstersia gyiorum]MCP1633405.1 hypothetical protein [Kerstersia gyiorum]MCP1679186.1 hypothetical protein [Kerstersia gyiorum]MCP1681988.1 hypothetical protein [Kerstersia gyiorum]MCP1712816.1 hypothetical protein [Kerstersia gyiorum]
MKKLSKLAIASTLAMMSMQSMAATVLGGATTAYVVAGPSTLQGPDLAGISMPSSAAGTPLPQSGIVSFAGGPIAQTKAAYNDPNHTGSYYYIKIGTTTFSQTWKAETANGTEIYAYRQISDPQPNYPHFGGEVVAKVPGYEVYFGEWAPKGSNTGMGNDTNLNLDNDLHTAFYVGENPTTSMPTLVNATYDVVGVSQYNPGTQDGVYTGILTANYGGGSNTLTGNIDYVSFANTTISADGSFANLDGSIKGHFYGDAAEALAGYYKDDLVPSDSMAFGGARQ